MVIPTRSSVILAFVCGKLVRLHVILDPEWSDCIQIKFKVTTIRGLWCDSRTLMISTEGYPTRLLHESLALCCW
ncbi:uncharacterized protein HD556DRAFT_1326342 [Suillus plorans]|uniref:Uncharacterized protein n=1 Tax=Suillus plorans TaxID=116603 RepID=A0A9P7J6A8_9AGAM|nr:uncharacterized protein HD556DRAFT_1326342 [Suillus plorans]KAG1804795.1 hypothetical protein HD556DRAFT_1326342 [Suillus plorans]